MGYIIIFMLQFYVDFEYFKKKKKNLDHLKCPRKCSHMKIFHLMKEHISTSIDTFFFPLIRLPKINLTWKNNNLLHHGIYSNILFFHIIFFLRNILIVFLFLIFHTHIYSYLSIVPSLLIPLCSSLMIFSSKIQLREDAEKNVINVLVIPYPPPLPKHKRSNDNS